MRRPAEVGPRAPGLTRCYPGRGHSPRMRRSVLRTSLPVLTFLGVAGCAGFYAEQRAWWRDQVEKACLSANLVQASSYVAPLRELDGPGSCGALRPFRVSAASGGTVGVQPAAVLACPMVSAFETWVTGALQPAAFAAYGTSVAEIELAGSYACRGVNGARGGRRSEHAYANAADVKGFRLADGREVRVLTGWRGLAQDQQFLHAVHDGACRHFSTVLGPDDNWYHRDHLHLDLARNRAGELRSSRPCRRVEALRRLQSPAQAATQAAPIGPSRDAATGGVLPAAAARVPPGASSGPAPLPAGSRDSAASPRGASSRPTHTAEPRVWPVPSATLGYGRSGGRDTGRDVIEDEDPEGD